MAINGPYYPVGAYLVEVTSQALGKSSTGTPQFALEFKVLGTPTSTEEGYEHGFAEQYKRTMWMYFTEKTVPYVKENLEKLGWRGGPISALDPSHPQHQSFVGIRIEMYCNHEADQNNNMREKWRISKKVQGTLDPKEMRQLDALFGKVGRTGHPAAPAAAQAPQTKGALLDSAELSDDDIPF